MFGSFVYVFLILAMDVSLGVASYRADEGITVGRASVEMLALK